MLVTHDYRFVIVASEFIMVLATTVLAASTDWSRFLLILYWPAFSHPLIFAGFFRNFFSSVSRSLSRSCSSPGRAFRPVNLTKQSLIACFVSGMPVIFSPMTFEASRKVGSFSMINACSGVLVFCRRTIQLDLIPTSKVDCVGFGTDRFQIVYIPLRYKLTPVSWW